MINKCLECGKEFETNLPRKKYCCLECQQKNLKQRALEYRRSVGKATKRTTCVVCGRVFRTCRPIETCKECRLLAKINKKATKNLSYAQIRERNRMNPLVSGYRGQRIIGGFSK
jgi:hypothetical protein